jgi:small GTP-binding protein
VALVGDASVGKTSLIRRFVVDVFDDKYIATIGTKVSKRDFEYKLPDKTIYLTLMMWDILGQKEYSRMRAQGLSGSHGVIFVSDLSRPETVKSIESFWMPELLQAVGNVPTVVVGNKNDLVTPTTPSVEDIKALAAKKKMLLLLTSAKTGEGVDAMFRKMGELMLSKDFGSDKTASEPSTESLAQAVDMIISDFCEQYGDTPKAMEIVDREFQRAKVDIGGPSKDALLTAIEFLSDIERDVHGRDVSEVNKLRRWKMIDEAR